MGKPPEWNFTRALTVLGKSLDENKWLRVLNGGVVVPETAAVLPSTSGKEKCDVSTKGTGRPETRPRPRAPGWQGTAGGSWTAGTAPPVVSGVTRKQYE